MCSRGGRERESAAEEGGVVDGMLRRRGGWDQTRVEAGVPRFEEYRKASSRF